MYLTLHTKHSVRTMYFTRPEPVATGTGKAACFTLHINPASLTAARTPRTRMLLSKTQELLLPLLREDSTGQIAAALDLLQQAKSLPENSLPLAPALNRTLREALALLPLRCEKPEELLACAQNLLAPLAVTDRGGQITGAVELLEEAENKARTALGA